MGTDDGADLHHQIHFRTAALLQHSLQNVHIAGALGIADINGGLAGLTGQLRVFVRQRLQRRLAAADGSPLDQVPSRPPTKATAGLTRPPRFRYSRSSTVNQWARFSRSFSTKAATSSMEAPLFIFSTASHTSIP